MNPVVRYTNGELQQLRGEALMIGARMSNNLRLNNGVIVAMVVAAAVNAQQTLSQTGGAATAGTFQIIVDGVGTTAAIAYNATAAIVRAALELVVGPGNVSCTGGALPGTPIVINGAGELAGIPINLMVVTGSTLNGGSTYAIANTTVGVPNKRFVAYDGSMVADPAVAPTVAGNGAASAFGAGTYMVSYTKVTAAGESLPSPAAPTIITAAQNLRVTAIAGLEASVTQINYYVGGHLAAKTAVVAGTAAQTDIAGIGFAGIPPHTSTAFVNNDGRQIPVGALKYDITTDAYGRVNYGTQIGSQLGVLKPDVPVFFSGQFRFGDLSGLDANAIKALSARFIRGVITDPNSEILIPD